MRALLVIATGAVLVAGCGDGGDSLGPLPAASLAGNWTFNWTNMHGTVAGFGSFSCNLVGLNATLTPADHTFTGQINGDWLMTCTAEGETVSEVGSGGVIRNGTISGDHVAFQLATADATQTGTISGGGMSGQATWRLNLGSPYGIVTLAGSWNAIRTADTRRSCNSPARPLRRPVPDSPSQLPGSLRDAEPGRGGLMERGDAPPIPSPRPPILHHAPT